MLAALLQITSKNNQEVKAVNCMSAVCITQECFPDTHAMHAMVVQRERQCQPFEDDIVQVQQPLLELAVGGRSTRAVKKGLACYLPFLLVSR